MPTIETVDFERILPQDLSSVCLKSMAYPKRRRSSFMSTPNLPESPSADNMSSVSHGPITPMIGVTSHFYDGSGVITNYNRELNSRRANRHVPTDDTPFVESDESDIEKSPYHRSKGLTGIPTLG